MDRSARRSWRRVPRQRPARLATLAAIGLPRARPRFDDRGTFRKIQEGTVLIARQDALDLLLLGFVPKSAHGPKHRQRVVVEGLDHQRPLQLALSISLVGLGLRRELLGGQPEGSGRFSVAGTSLVLKVAAAPWSVPIMARA